ncbi:unnamed protein product (macronuclear) [Paramecium tetraurelia]|uniref:Sfi1 spindle body domain-containing protein n=1 Tax=Paramecium tetraurelia TaxID=5888 RepID=A0BTA8_PARTE|nr:uncharacterized protein GSPATT00032007001 [Paramecium tetraurelia]CAK61775.1 unnamed protein product [Paramecium tetraurelia]|eukprot:XP_001429173.1 hypothetical protein (macronuclear) [Paramecium tetraurelia strain d4-2]
MLSDTKYDILLSISNQLSTKLSPKLKGIIVSQLIKTQQNLTLQDAFIRWQVRTNPEIVKQAVDKILLNSKLNQFNAFHKLKFLLGTKQPKEARMNARKKKNLSLINLALFIQKKELQLKRQAIESIKPTSQDSNKMLGLLIWSISSKYRERYLREKFNWWKLIAKMKSNKLEKQLKALEILGDEYNMRNDRLDRSRLKEAFEIWRGDLLNFRLKKKFFAVLLKTTFGRLQRCYTRWVDLPDKRENDIKKQGLLLINKLGNKVDQNKRLVWNAFKDLHDEAKNKKTKVIRELIEVTFNQSYTAFYKWANYNTYAKLTETNLKKIKSLQQSANVTHQLVKQETFKLFNLSKKMQICSFLDKIILKLQQKQKLDALRQIENYCVQKKMEEKLNNINKQDLIARLKETANKTEKGLLKQILRKFQINRETQEIKNKYFGKILLSVNGQLIDSFRKWKILPNPDDINNIQKVSKFQMKLQLFIVNKHKQAYDPLKYLYYEALQKKRFCIRQLFSVTMSAPQRYIKQWQNVAKVYKSVVACQKTNNLFYSLAMILQSNLLAFIQNKKDVDIKEKCIQKILASQHSNLAIAFFRWKSQNKQQQILERLGDEKMKFLILNLKKFLENDKKQRLRRALNLFNSNLQLAQQIKKINLRLMQTVIGQVSTSFQKWKYLPEDRVNGKTVKVSKFMISLGRVAYRFVKVNSWNILEDDLLEGQAKKKYCINKIFSVGQSDLKTAFLSWHRRSWEMKMFDQFSQLNVTLNDEIIKQRLVNWINSGYKVKHYALIEILKRFHQNAQSYNLRRKALAIIHRNTISQVWISFNKWKQIPELDYSQLAKVTKFEQQFNHFLIRQTKKKIWNPLYEIYDDALAIKKRAVLLLIKTQESEQQKALSNWNKNVSLIQEVERCKSVILLFKFVGDQIQFNLQIMQPNQESRLKEKALLKIIGGNYDNIRYFFMRWTNYLKFERIQAIEGEKKEFLIRQIGFFYRNNMKSKLRLALSKFKRNSVLSAVQQKFFSKLFSTKFGGAIVAFQKWKNLPEIQNFENLKKGRRLEKILENLYRGRIKLSYDPLKDEYQEAMNKKLHCIRKLIILGMGLNKRLFLQWRNTNKLLKSIETCKQTTNFFQTLALTLSGNVQVIFKTNQLQEKVFEKMLSKYNNLLRWGFIKWNNQAKSAKIASLMDQEKRKFLLFALQRNLKHNQNGQLRDILRKFNDGRSRQNLIKKIQLKLLHTFAGQVETSFLKWKQLPDPSNLKQASIFEQKLNSFKLQVLRKSSFKYLQNIYQDGQAKQKFAINKLLFNCMSAEKKAFLEWNKVSELQRTEQRASKVFSFFGSINKIQQNHMYFFFEDQIKELKKQEELVRLLKEWEDMFKDSYQKWKQTQAKLDLLASQNRQKQKFSIIEILKDYIQNKKNYNLRLILRKFSNSNQRQKAVNKFLLGISNSSIGQLHNSFQMWRRLPEPQKTKQGYIFEKKLFGLFRRQLLQSFDGLQDLYFQALNKKRRVVLLLVRTTKSQQQQSVQRWRDAINQMNQQELQNVQENRKLAIQLFYQHKMNQLNVAFIEWRDTIRIHTNKQENKTQKEERLKKEAILLFQNYAYVRLRVYFTQWKIRAVKRNMIQICQAIQRMIQLNRFAEKAIKKYVMDVWKGQPSKNKWFKRVADIIAKNSRISKQVAYWRMRDNSLNQKAVGLSTQQIIKCKKLFNNLCKAFDRIKQRAFTHLEHYGKGIPDDTSFQPSHSSFLQQTPIKDAFFKSDFDSIIQKNGQKLALNAISRVFKGFLKQRFIEFMIELDDQKQKSWSTPQKKGAEKLFAILEQNLKLKQQVICYQISQVNEQGVLNQINEIINYQQSTQSASRLELSQIKEQQTKLNEQERMILDLQEKLRCMAIHRLFKALEKCEDHFVEDAFLGISEYQLK